MKRFWGAYGFWLVVYAVVVSRVAMTTPHIGDLLVGILMALSLTLSVATVVRLSETRWPGVAVWSPLVRRWAAWWAANVCFVLCWGGLCMSGFWNVFRAEMGGFSLLIACIAATTRTVCHVRADIMDLRRAGKHQV